MSSALSLPAAAPAERMKGTLPMGTAAFSAVLTYVGVAVVSAGTAEARGNVAVSLLLLMMAGLGVLVRPAAVLRLFAGTYVALYVLSFSGLLGNSIQAYLSFVVAVGYVVRTYTLGGRLRSARLPDTALILALVGLMALQFPRSQDIWLLAMRQMCNAVAFALLIRRTPEAGAERVRGLAVSYVFGASAACFVLLTYGAFTAGRFGEELGLGSGYLGFVSGIAIVMVFSRTIFPGHAVLRLVLALPLMAMLYLSGARAAFYATILGVLLTLILEKRKAVLAGVLIGLSFLGLALFQASESLTTTAAWISANPEQQMLGRFASPFAQSFENSSALRAFIWAYLLSRAGDYWMLGLGLGNTPFLTAQAPLPAIKGLQSHDFYLACFVDLGILGLLLALIWHVRMGWRALRWRRSHPLLLPMVVYFLIQAIFSGLNLDFLSWLYLAVGYMLTLNSGPKDLAQEAR